MDLVRDTFLRRQFEEGMALAEQSDLLDLTPVAGDPPDRYVARFTCRGLVWGDDGPELAELFLAGITFPADYLAEIEPLRIVTWLGPRNVFHPNVSDRAPVFCPGHLYPGTSLADILHQIHDVITWNNATFNERDALNPRACAWGRQNPARFPVDRRPLRRRPIELRIEELR